MRDFGVMLETVERDEKTKKLVEGKYRDEAIEYLKDNQWQFTEKIDGTNINYPVMQNSEYYLRRNIYKEYSTYGTPFLADYCNINSSDNLIIYLKWQLLIYG